MSSAHLALVVATLLCLTFNATRAIGVAGAAVLVFLYPLLSTALLVLGGVAFYFIHHRKRSTIHELPKLPKLPKLPFRRD